MQSCFFIWKKNGKLEISFYFFYFKYKYEEHLLELQFKKFFIWGQFLLLNVELVLSSGLKAISNITNWNKISTQTLFNKQIHPTFPF